MDLLAICFALKHLHHILAFGLHFTILSDCAALNGVHIIDLNTLDCNRILKAVKGILPHNIAISYIPAKHNHVAVFLSLTATESPQMPDIDKYISSASHVASLNLIFDGKVLDIQLDSIAKTGSEEEGYNTLDDIIREGNPAEGINDSYPSYEYMPYIKDLTLLEMPSGSLIIFPIL